MSVNNMISFSVLMSVYKNEKPRFLDQALRSIENQTVMPKEFIVIIDGPITEKLREVISYHEDRYPELYKIIESPVNNGLGKSLQIGSQYVTTNWIARMDSDDIAVKNRFELQLSFIKKHPNLAILGGQVSEFSGIESNIVGYRKVPVSPELIKHYIVWRSPFNHPTVMINKHSLEKAGGYRSFGKLEDYDLWVRMVQSKFEVYNLPNVLVNMRIDNGIYSHRGEINNLRYVIKLRKELRKGKSITILQEYIGDLFMIINILMPSSMRKILYQKFLHRK